MVTGTWVSHLVQRGGAQGVHRVNLVVMRVVPVRIDALAPPYEQHALHVCLGFQHAEAGGIDPQSLGEIIEGI